MSRSCTHWFLLATIALAACADAPTATTDQDPDADTLAHPSPMGSRARGIYVLDSSQGTYREANIRAYPFVVGYVLRPSWSELEPQQDRYDFRMIDEVIRRLEPLGKKLSLEVMRPPEPAYLAATSGVTTWFDTDTRVNVHRPVPWDPYALERFRAFAKALGDHGVADATRGGALTPLRDHPVLANVNLAIPGAHAAIRDPIFHRLRDFTGYTREQLEAAVLSDLHAVTDNFQEKVAYIGFWTIEDGTPSPGLWEQLRTAILAEFNGIKNPKVAFFQENLAASSDGTTISGRPNPTFASTLTLSKDQTAIMFQMLQSWNTPFQNPPATRGTTPMDAMQWAHDTYGTTYFEVYVADIDDRDFWPGFQVWHDRLMK